MSKSPILSRTPNFEDTFCSLQKKNFTPVTPAAPSGHLASELVPQFGHACRKDRENELRYGYAPSSLCWPWMSQKLYPNDLKMSITDPKPLPTETSSRKTPICSTASSLRQHGLCLGGTAVVGPSAVGRGLLGHLGLTALKSPVLDC